MNKASEAAVSVAAHKLAIRFTEDTNLPARLQRNSSKKPTAKASSKDSDISRRFQANVDSWILTVNNLIVELDYALAWRLINLNPVATPQELSSNTDFLALINHLQKQRNKKNFNAGEIGNLAMLSVAIQKKIVSEHGDNCLP